MTKSSKLFIVTLIISCLSIVMLKWWGDIEFKQQEKSVQQFRQAIRLKKKDPEQSIQILSALEKKAPNNYEILYHLAQAYKNNRDLKKADIYLDKTITQKPTMVMDFSFVLKCADVALERKNIQKAEKFIEQARSLVRTPSGDKKCKLREDELKKLEDSKQNANKSIFAVTTS